MQYCVSVTFISNFSVSNVTLDSFFLPTHPRSKGKDNLEIFRTVYIWNVYGKMALK